MPAHLAGVSGVLRFCCSIVESTADLVCAYKPNLAFFERWGAEGWHALEQVVAAIPGDIPVIADGKRGDIGNTSSAYADALYGRLRVSAVTASPYLGRDAVAPIIDYPGGFAFVLCRTSNPGAGDVQDLVVDGEPIYAKVIRLFKPELDSNKAGLVIGAKAGHAFRWAARLAPDAPILVPGIGTQGGTVEELGAVISSRQASTVVVSVSRSVIHASTGQDFAAAARRRAKELRTSLQSALSIAMERGHDAGAG
jgi:orotidine-5'-phosphate decarboxylase